MFPRLASILFPQVFKIKGVRHGLSVPTKEFEMDGGGGEA